MIKKLSSWICLTMVLGLITCQSFAWNDATHMSIPEKGLDMLIKDLSYEDQNDSQFQGVLTRSLCQVKVGKFLFIPVDLISRVFVC